MNGGTTREVGNKIAVGTEVVTAMIMVTHGADIGIDPVTSAMAAMIDATTGEMRGVMIAVITDVMSVARNGAMTIKMTDGTIGVIAVTIVAIVAPTARSTLAMKPAPTNQSPKRNLALPLGQIGGKTRARLYLGALWSR